MQNAKFKISVQNSKVFRTFYFCLVFLTFNFLLLTFPINVYAQNTPDFGQSLIHPAQPIYFLKTIRERLEMGLAMSKASKAKLQIDFGSRRIRETNSLIKAGREDLIEQTLEKYRHQMKVAYDLSAENNDLNEQIKAGFSQQVDDLVSLYERASNQAARRAIRASIFQSRTPDCQFLERTSLEMEINEAERSILKQKTDECKDKV